MEQPTRSSDPVRVTDPAAARILTDPRARSFLAPFIGRDRTLGDVADELGVAMSTLYYRVDQLRRVGLLAIARVEPRRGRPVKHYRAIAERFFVPFGATTLVTPESISAEVFGALRRALDEGIGSAWSAMAGDERPLGVHVFRSVDGGVLLDVAPEAPGTDVSAFFGALLADDAPAVWDSWPVLRLEHAEAKSLQRHLAALLRPYQAHSAAPGARSYLVRLAMAPRRD